MHIVYLHGLDSDPSATKAHLTRTFAQSKQVHVSVPDLNIPPQAVVHTLLSLIDADTVLIGSSLGGYFANLLSDLTGVPAVLLNPSIRPDVSFRRFLVGLEQHNLQADSVVYRTTGGLEIVYGDLAWFCQHRLQVKHPKRLAVFLSLDDTLLDARHTQVFYEKHGVQVFADPTGGHKMSNYAERLDCVFANAQTLLSKTTFHTQQP